MTLVYFKMALDASKSSSIISTFVVNCVWLNRKLKILLARGKSAAASEVIYSLLSSRAFMHCLTYDLLCKYVTIVLLSCFVPIYIAKLFMVLVCSAILNIWGYF